MSLRLIQFTTLDLLCCLLLLAVIPLRLFFFSGFGLGDDCNESAAVISFADNLRLNPLDFAHYRVTNILLRGSLYLLFGVNEVAFLAPVFLCAFATNVITVIIARSILGPLGALATAFFILVTPFETLASTANVPDYFHALGISLCSYFLIRYLREPKLKWAGYSNLALVFALLNRLSTFLILPVLALATLFSVRARGKTWALWWSLLLSALGVICIWDYFYSGSPFRWIVFNSGGGGVDVTNILSYILMVYPKYLFWKDDHGNFMFGLTGWCAALGGTLGIYRILTRRATAGEALCLCCGFLYLILFEFLPHRLTFEAFYSHSRIFRYLPQIAPTLYIGAAYFISRCFESPGKPLPRAFATLLLGSAGAIGLWQIPPVTFPLRDAHQDIRALLDYLSTEHIPPHFVITTDYWRCNIISGLRHPQYLANRLNCITPDSDEEKRRMLSEAPEGIIITGGATLPWYSGIDLIVSLSRLGLDPNPRWKLRTERKAETEPWRAEPLRIWYNPTLTSGP